MSTAEANLNTAHAAAHVGRGAAILAAATLFCKAGSLAVVPFILRAFSREAYGEYSAAFAYAGLLGMVAYFGMNPIVTRDIARGEKPRGWVILHCTALRLILLVVAAGALTFVGIAKGFTAGMWALAWLAFAAMSFDAVTGAVKAAMQAEGRFARMALVEMVRKASQWVLAILVIVLGANIVMLAGGVALAAAAAFAAALAMGMSRNDLADMGLAPSYAMKMLRLAAPMGLSAAFVLALKQVNIWMLDILRGPVDVATYQAGVLFKPDFLAQSVVWAILPLAFKLARDDRSQLADAIRAASRYLGIGGWALAMIFFCGGATFVPLLAGGQYRESIWVFRLLGLSLPFAFVSLLYLHALTAVDKQVIAAVIFAVGLLTNFAIDVALVPRLGASGAIIGTLATEILIAAASFAAVWKTVGRPFGSLDGKALAAILAGIAVAALSSAVNLPDMGILGVAALVSVLFFLKVVSRKDVAFVQAVLGAK